MIEFNRFTLDNGLIVIVHNDNSTPFVVVNVTYNVGARDENPNRTGFAHLFEHLMFGGSENAPVFDRPLELAGANNNAFTSNDVTNYYEVIPRENIETALWLESDRMSFLAINERSLEVQRKVVIEEFKERYLNQPYGETWHYLRELAFEEHPYKWPTIGLTIDHIADASLEDVKGFYEKFYHPNNAVLTLAGNINVDEAKELATKWFGDLKAGSNYIRNIAKEPKQTRAKRKEIEVEVPLNMVHIAFHMPGRGEKDYYECDLISDILGNGDSARLNQILVKEKQILSEANAYILGSFENGLFVIQGKPQNGISNEEAEREIWNVIQSIVDDVPTENELQKLQNKVEATLTYQLMDPMNKALNLAFFEIMGDANEANLEKGKYQAVTAESFHRVAKELFAKENSITLWQLAKTNKLMIRSKAPKIFPIKTIELLDAYKIGLKNKIDLYLLEGGDQEVVSLEIIIPAGRWQESKPMQSQFTSALFKDGTAHKNSQEISEIIDFYGAHLNVSTSYDYTSIQLVTLTKHLQPLLDLMIELFDSPSFTEEELAIKRNNYIQKLKVNEEKTDFVAQRLLHEKTFGEEHPYGYSSSVEKYNAITSQDLKDFFQTQFSISDGFVILAGKIDEPVINQIKDALEQIHSKERQAEPKDHKVDSQPGQYHIKKENSQQASIRIGQLMIDASHEDFQALQVLNTVLGGYFGSRLMSNLREDKGYTYGVYSAIGSFLQQGYLMISTDVGTDQAENAVKEIYAEIEKIQQELIPEDELELVKNYMMGNYLGKIDGPFSQAKQFKSLILQGKTAGDFEKSVKSIQTLTSEHLKDLANKYYDKSKMIEIVVG